VSNINPTLIFGQAQAWLEAQGKNIPEHQQRDIEVRVYDPNDGAGYYFVRGQSALKWYRDDDPTDGHFNNCTLEDVQCAINNNARVQIVGYRGTSYGVWSSWDKFAREVLDAQT